jgi:hypothetical protein
MPETKFTPGPWVALKGCGWCVSRPDAIKRREAALVVGMTPCTSLIGSGTFPDNDMESQANAHLIAAAPELYAALEAASDTLDACGRDTIGTPTCDFFRMQVDECNAVLAKARGEK